MPPEARSSRDGGSPSSALTVFRAMFGLDPRSLALFRVGLAAVVLGDLAVRAGDLRTFYSDDGVLPRALVVERLWHPGYFSFHLASGATGFEGALFVAAAAFAVCLAVGYRTRVATIASWALLVSLQNRNAEVLSSADVLLRVLLFWAMFLPLGARASLDARRGAFIGDANRDGLVASAGTVALLVQTASVYVFAGLMKLEDGTWRDGTCLVYAIRAPEFATWFSLRASGDVTFWSSVGRAVPYVEILAPLLLLSPIRPAVCKGLAATIFFSFHLGIALFMSIGVFVPVSLVTWLAFVPSVAWDRLAPAWRQLFAPLVARGTQLFSPRRDPPSRAPPIKSISVVSATRRGVIALSNAVCLTLAGAVVFWNLNTIRPARFVVPDLLDRVFATLRLDQRWDMFSRPIMASHWLVMPARLRSGALVDVRTGEPVSWARPEIVSRTFRNDRWRKYMLTLEGRQQEAERLAYARALCNEWNATHSLRDALEAFELYAVHVPTLQRGPVGGPARSLLFQAECDGGLLRKWDTAH